MTWPKDFFSSSGLIDVVHGKTVDCICSMQDRAFSKFCSLWNVEAEGEKLRRTQTRIYATLADAEERRYIEDDSVKLWLRDLKAVAFHVDTLRDTMAAMSKKDDAESSRKRKHSWPSVQLTPLQRCRLDAKIAKINDWFKQITKDKEKLRIQPGDARRYTPEPRPPEAAARSHERIFGRINEKDEIVQALISDSDTAVRVISICGGPGIGKTTLAQFVYSDPIVESFFGVKIWVCLFDQCDVKTATKMIIEAVTRRKCNLLSLDVLQQQLCEHLSICRFLLVIDNHWAENYEFWDSLRPSLAGVGGSKVLITTRNEGVWRRASADHNINLKGLGSNDCWLLLQDLCILTWEILGAG